MKSVGVAVLAVLSAAAMHGVIADVPVLGILKPEFIAQLNGEQPEPVPVQPLEPAPAVVTENGAVIPPVLNHLDRDFLKRIDPARLIPNPAPPVVPEPGEPKQPGQEPPNNVEEPANSEPVNPKKDNSGSRASYAVASGLTAASALVAFLFI